ncbi:MAG TPA: hypothetical protein VFM12_06350 [Gemmatimonadales bacterium]|nr:hypothetical protein [Gemmatimonadales bacterium]
MRFTILFRDGAAVADETADAQDITDIARLLEAKAQGENHLTVGLAGGRRRTVADIRSIELEAEWP